jgi:5-methylcytosine-specific restriction endonuclease McrA
LAALEAWLDNAGPCVYCGAAEVGIDHVVPVALGGAHKISNFQPMCGVCNTIKLDMTESELLAHMEKILPALRAKVNGPQ